MFFKTFEEFLRDKHAKYHSDGILDDELNDHFENWLVGLDVDYWLEYTDQYVDLVKEFYLRKNNKNEKNKQKS